MRVLLAQLAPRRGEVGANLARLEAVVAAAPSDLAVFPELFLSGYRVGDLVHRLALVPGDAVWRRLAEAARKGATSLVVGAPVAAGRPGEVHNAALLATPDGRVDYQVKRYLPTYGPFEEGSYFTPATASEPKGLPGARAGLEICYDAFFPEVTRELALAGAEIAVAISAAPVTSRRLFDKVLPARAVENAMPLVYVNRVGVEDGVVFGGGSGVWDPRGEAVALAEVPFERREAEEGVWTAEVDLAEAARWRPFRPVLRDVASRPPRPGPSPVAAGRTDAL